MRTYRIRGEDRPNEKNMVEMEEGEAVASYKEQLSLIEAAGGGHVTGARVQESANSEKFQPIENPELVRESTRVK